MGSEEIDFQTNKKNTNVIEKIVNLKVNGKKNSQYKTYLFTTQQYFKEAVRISKSVSEMDKEINPILKFTPDTFNLNNQMISSTKKEGKMEIDKRQNKPVFVTYFRDQDLSDLKSRDATISRQALEKELLDKAYKCTDKENNKFLPEDYIRTRYVS